jgi:TP901 family phage tail tape measure protein
VARNPAVLVSLLADWNGKDLEKAQREIQKLQDKSKTTADKFADVGRKFQDVGGKMSKVGGSLTKSLTVPIAGIGTAAVLSASEFEESMAKIVGLVGISADKVDGMRDGVLDLAGTTAKAPKELSDALFVITSAGLRGEDAMNALESASKASAAGLGDTTDISRALSGAMNAYGSDTLSAAQATDIIVAAARAGNFETSQFAGSLGDVLPAAQLAEASFADTAGAVSLLTRTNGDAGKSITQVRALFNKLGTPTKQTIKALGEVGLTAGDLRESMAEQGLVGTLGLLNDAFDGNQEKIGNVLGSVEAQSAAFTILNSDAQTISDTFGVVADSAGITDEAFGVVQETTAFKMRKAFADLKASLIDIGEIILPFVQKFADGFATIAQKFRDLTPAQQELIVKIGAIVAAIGPVLLIAGKFIGAIGGIIAVFNPLTLKIALVVGAIALLVGAFMYAWNNSETLRDTVMAAFNRIRETVASVIDRIKEAIDNNRDTLIKMRDAFQTVIQFIIDNVVPAIVTFYSVYLQALITFIGLIIEAIVELIAFWVRVIAKLIEVGVAIAEFVAAAFAKYQEFTENVRQAFIDAFTAVRDFITGVFDAIGSAITETITSAVNFVIRAINRVISAWNGISFTTPSVTVGVGPAAVTFGPYTLGTNNLPTIPELADGGIVNKATLAIIGEAGPEAVVPLSNRRGNAAMGSTTINITVKAGMGADGGTIGREIVDALKQYEKRNGPLPVRVSG